MTVIDGTAHLYGTVDSYFEKGRADDVASRISGVLDVENHLLVDDVTAYIYSPYVDDFFNDDELIEYERRAPSQTDSEIKDSIESELWWSPFVDSDEVSVAVNNGVATMTGSVGTWGERRGRRKTPMRAARRWSKTIWSSTATGDRLRRESKVGLLAPSVDVVDSRRLDEQ